MTRCVVCGNLDAYCTCGKPAEEEQLADAIAATATTRESGLIEAKPPPKPNRAQRRGNAQHPRQRRKSKRRR